MAIVYHKLFKLLRKHGYNSTIIRKENILGQRTLTAIKNGIGGIDHRTIDKLCCLLSCQPGDLMEYVPDGEAAKAFLKRIMKEEITAATGYYLVPNIEDKVRHGVEAKIMDAIESDPSLCEEYSKIISSNLTHKAKEKALRDYIRDHREAIRDVIDDYMDDLIPRGSMMNLKNR